MSNRKPPASLTGALLARKGTASPAGLEDKPFDRTPLTRVTPEAAAAAVNLGAHVPGHGGVVETALLDTNAPQYANGAHATKAPSVNGFRTRSDIVLLAIVVVGALALGWGFNAISEALVGEDGVGGLAMTSSPNLAENDDLSEPLPVSGEAGSVSEALQSVRLGLADQSFGISRRIEVPSPDGAWRPVTLKTAEEAALSDDEARRPAPKPGAAAPRPTRKPDATVLLPQSVPVPLPKPQWVRKLQPGDTPQQDTQQRDTQQAFDRSGDRPAAGANKGRPQPTAQVDLPKATVAVKDIAKLTTADQDRDQPFRQISAPRFAIQLAAVGSAQEALRERRRIESTYREILGDLKLTVSPDLGSDAAKRYRIQSATSFDQEPAQSLCARLTAQSEDCAVVAR